jgi:hypothetical protein
MHRKVLNLDSRQTAMDTLIVTKTHGVLIAARPLRDRIRGMFESRSDSATIKISYEVNFDLHSIETKKS